MNTWDDTPQERHHPSLLSCVVLRGILPGSCYAFQWLASMSTGPSHEFLFFAWHYSHVLSLTTINDMPNGNKNGLISVDVSNGTGIYGKYILMLASLQYPNELYGCILEVLRNRFLSSQMFTCITNKRERYKSSNTGWEKKRHPFGITGKC